MVRPNFFIPGAPKCGTSSLAHWLSRHPQVFFSPAKEPAFFSTDIHVHRRLELEQYEALFSAAKPEHLAIGEATTSYLYSRDAVPTILRFAESPRFIVCIRNPVDMCISLHGQRLREGCESVANLEDAWKLQSERRQGRRIPILCKDPKTLMYGEICRLGEQLERLYAQVDSEQIHVVVLDDMARDPEAEYLKVIRFLGLDPFVPEQFEVRNPARAIPFPLAFLIRVSIRMKKSLGIYRGLGMKNRFERMLGRPPGKREISPEFEQELITCFSRDIDQLERLLKRDFSSWRLPGPVKRERECLK